jgi:hypothetical protein
MPKKESKFTGLLASSDATKVHHMLNAIGGNSPGIDKLNELIGNRELPQELANTGKVLQLKISLKHSSPPIWRRILVPSEASLEDIHFLIQAVMDWDGDHLHEFEYKGHHLGSPYDDYADEVYEGVLIGHLLRAPKDKMLYHYDFGASWKHDILLEKVLDTKEGQQYPFCTAGRQPAPEEYPDWDEERQEEVSGNPQPFTVDGVNKILSRFW